MNAEGDVRYVLSGIPTGWGSMAKTIREVDEYKVKDYKEDIDTLLVFTGLFSAILTAFVIESYQNLSPDKQDVIIQLLGQILSQTNNYVVTSSTINSTIHLSNKDTPVFEPPLSAVRVNQLWFASLIVTLITASFAMLVKQWLREYLAMDYTSPHERIRARQFRHSALSTWKVYEIAGVLPLLLQLALGLFLLGLCFFTLSVNTSVGKMSITLVAGWAFFFISATIAPIFSPRCPYKIALLKRVTIVLRRYLRRLLYPESMQTGLRLVSHLAAMGSAFDSELRLRSVRGHPFLEEAEAVKRDDDELTILREVDTFLLDDELLGTTILDSLMQNYTSPSAIIKFVLQALSLRLKGNELTSPLSSPPDLRRLTKRGWIAVSDIVAATVLKNSSAAAAGTWLQDAMYLLLSISEQPMTSGSLDAVLRYVQRATLPQVTNNLTMLAASSATIVRFHDLLGPVAARLHELLLQREIQPADTVAFVINILTSELGQTELSVPLSSTLDLQSLSEPIWKFSCTLLTTTIEHSFVPDRSQSEVGSWFEDAVYILLSPSAYPIAPAGIKILAGLCSKDKQGRWATCVRRLASPDFKDFACVLSRLHEICKHVNTGGCASWLLKMMAHSLPCRCTVPPGSDTEPSLAIVLAKHVPGHEEWTTHFASILVERASGILTSQLHWPHGSSDSLWALMSLPIYNHSTNEELRNLLLTVICSVVYSTDALRPLVSTDPVWRSNIASDAAVHCISYLVTTADITVRRGFVHTVWRACQAYLMDHTRKRQAGIETMNVVRYASFVSLIHADVREDMRLSQDWTTYYTTTAQAMSIFRTEKYPVLPADEKAHTVRLAEECLNTLDNMELATENVDGREMSVDTNTSIIPDTIFKELGEFLTNDVASRCRRLRCLREESIHVSGEGTANTTKSTAATSQEVVGPRTSADCEARTNSALRIARAHSPSSKGCCIP